MGLFKGLVNLAAAAVTAPVALAADSVTGFGMFRDDRESFSEKTAKKAARAIEDMTDDEWED